MNPRFKGLGMVIFLVPLLLAILLRMFFGDEESSNRAIYLCATMSFTGAITFGIAVVQDRKIGIDPFSRRAWTSELLESEHIFLHLPFPRFMKNILLLFCLCSPAILCGQAKLLVDAIPTAATFVGVTPIALPFKDAAKENPKEIEEGLSGAISQMLPAASQQGFSYVCLLSAPGDQPVVIHLAAGTTDLKLSRTATAVWALFYKGGYEATRRIEYSTGSPEAKTAHVSSTFQKISVPQGVSTAGWIYFNLPRIQAEAEKARSPIVFLSAGGSGATTAVAIPGLKEPLMVPEDRSTFTVTWYMDPDMAATHKGEVLGHPMPANGAKLKQ